MWFEMCLIPCTTEMDFVEAELANALVVMVGRTRPTVTTNQVLLHLAHHHPTEPYEVQVWRARPDDFILTFSLAPLAARVLLTPPPQEAELVLRF
jgi:hypothetical protein